MLSSIISSESPPEARTLRDSVRPSDAVAVERLARMTGVFNAGEIAIARELVEDHLARGAEASGYRFLFADGAAGLDGYVCYGPIPGTAGRFELYWIAVDPSIRRTGLGARLQCAAEGAVRALGGRYLIAETSTLADYAPARRFYSGQGYALVAEIPDWHDDGDGLAIFRKRL